MHEFCGFALHFHVVEVLTLPAFESSVISCSSCVQCVYGFGSASTHKGLSDLRRLVDWRLWGFLVLSALPMGIALSLAATYSLLTMSLFTGKFTCRCAVRQSICTGKAMGLLLKLRAILRPAKGSVWPKSAYIFLQVPCCLHTDGCRPRTFTLARGPLPLFL